MYIEITDETHSLPKAILGLIEGVLESAAAHLGLPKSKEMSITFVNSTRSREINRKFRGIDQPTDVISLEYKPEDISFTDEEGGGVSEDLLAEMDPFIGEIYINIDQALDQSKTYGHSLEREYGWLSVHGFLHINGYDHANPEQEEEMFTLQEEVLTEYGLTR